MFFTLGGNPIRIWKPLLMEVLIKYIGYYMFFKFEGTLSLNANFHKILRYYMFFKFGDPNFRKIHEYFMFFKLRGTLLSYGKFHKIHWYYRFFKFWEPYFLMEMYNEMFCKFGGIIFDGKFHKIAQYTMFLNLGEPYYLISFSTSSLKNLPECWIWLVSYYPIQTIKNNYEINHEFLCAPLI